MNHNDVMPSYFGGRLIAQDHNVVAFVQKQLKKHKIE